MNIILLGPPGAGKGTQSKYLEDRFHFKQLSSGDMLRHAVTTGSPVGILAKPFMEGGKLVPDQVVAGVIFETIEGLPADLPGFILDGFPRTVEQAQMLDDLLGRHAKDIGAVIVLEISDELLVKRISGRFTCGTCGEVYNDFFRLPKVESVCDRCSGTSFKHRSDDNAETVRERLDIYHNQTKPLIDYYRAKGKLHAVNGELSMDDVKFRINAIVEGVEGQAAAR